ncbi:MAG: tetratricopeptide repeat protein [Acetobacter sp.]|nr:tetratricopeptide repeat protein [Acetobacter sp.]
MRGKRKRFVFFVWTALVWVDVGSSLYAAVPTIKESYPSKNTLSTSVESPSSSGSPLQGSTADQLVKKGILLGNSGKWKEAIALYNVVIQQCENSQTLSLRLALAGALYNKGIAFFELGRWPESISAFNDVIHRFDTAQDPPLQEQVVKARKWVSILRRSGG